MEFKFQELLNQAITDKRLSDESFRVLFYFCKFCNTPQSQSSMAEKLGLTDNSFMDCKRQLELCGYISIMDNCIVVNSEPKQK